MMLTDHFVGVNCCSALILSMGTIHQFDCFMYISCMHMCMVCHSIGKRTMSEKYELPIQKRERKMKRKKLEITIRSCLKINPFSVKQS